MIRFGHFWGLLSELQNYESTLAIILCEWTIFHRCKRPNVEQIISPSGHVVQALSVSLSLILTLFLNILNRGFLYRIIFISISIGTD